MGDTDDEDETSSRPKPRVVAGHSTKHESDEDPKARVKDLKRRNTSKRSFGRLSRSTNHLADA